MTIKTVINLLHLHLHLPCPPPSPYTDHSKVVISWSWAEIVYWIIVQCRLGALYLSCKQTIENYFISSITCFKRIFGHCPPQFLLNKLNQLYVILLIATLLFWDLISDHIDELTPSFIEDEQSKAVVNKNWHSPVWDWGEEEKQIWTRPRGRI